MSKVTCSFQNEDINKLLHQRRGESDELTLHEEVRKVCRECTRAMLNDEGGLLSTKGKEHFKQEEQAGTKAKWDQGNVCWFLVTGN